jgi:hypothetical protein
VNNYGALEAGVVDGVVIDGGGAAELRSGSQFGG